MGLLSEIKQAFYEQDLKYKAGISQQVGFKIGRMLMFLGARAHLREKVTLNGPYSVVSDPQLGVDGLFIFQHDAEIFNAFMYNNDPGSSGTTELDAKIATSPGGAFTSIFATTPKISFNATPYAWIGVGDVVANCVAPVLTSSPVLVTAGSALRVDKISSQAGGRNAVLIIHYRPR